MTKKQYIVVSSDGISTAFSCREAFSKREAEDFHKESFGQKIRGWNNSSTYCFTFGEGSYIEQFWVEDRFVRFEESY